MSETLKKEAEELVQKKGSVKGEAFRTQTEYIRRCKGEEGLKKVLKKMEEMGYPFEIKKLKYQQWYPEALDVLLILTAKEIFSWKDEDIFKMGYSAPRQSFIIKLSAQHLFSIKSITKAASTLWKKHFDFGNLKVELDEEKKRIKVIIEEYKIHPVMCKFFEGYFLSVFELCTKSEKVRIEEIKCAFKGDSAHEYLMEW